MKEEQTCPLRTCLFHSHSTLFISLYIILLILPSRAYNRHIQTYICYFFQKNTWDQQQHLESKKKKKFNDTATALKHTKVLKINLTKDV